MKQTKLTGFFLSLICLSSFQLAIAESNYYPAESYTSSDYSTGNSTTDSYAYPTAYPTDSYTTNSYVTDNYAGSNNYGADYYYANPSACCASPTCCDQNKWKFGADFLYWTTNFNTVRGLDVSIQNTSTLTEATVNVAHPKQKWDPGVRVTAGWSGCDNLDVLGSWTYFYNSNANHHSPFMLQIDTTTITAAGGAKFVYRYNAADLELGKTLCLSPWLVIRPLIGVHAVWLELDNALNLTISQPGTYGLAISLNAKAWGVGPKLGVNTNWGNYNGFSLVGNVNGSFVYGKHDGKVNAMVDISSPMDVNVHLTGQSHWVLMSTVQLQSGFSYATSFWGNEFRLNALWECNLINQADNVLILERSISTQGLTLGLEFTF